MKNIIEITEDFEIPGTDIMLEKGDKFKIVEAVAGYWYEAETGIASIDSHEGYLLWLKDIGEGSEELASYSFEDAVESSPFEFVSGRMYGVEDTNALSTFERYKKFVITSINEAKESVKEAIDYVALAQNPITMDTLYQFLTDENTYLEDDELMDIFGTSDLPEIISNLKKHFYVERVSTNPLEVSNIPIKLSAPYSKYKYIAVWLDADGVFLIGTDKKDYEDYIEYAG